MRKHGCTFIFEIIFFSYENRIFFFIISVSFNMYFYVLISLLIAVLVLSLLFCLFHKRTGVSRQCIKAIFPAIDDP